MSNKPITLLTLALLAIAGPADATPDSTTWWSSIGAACTPANSAIQGNLYSNVGGAISVSSSSPVVVYCPIHTLKLSPDYLGMTSKG